MTAGRPPPRRGTAVRHDRRRLLALGVFGPHDVPALARVTDARASGVPDRITLVVPSAAGGAGDTLARLLGQAWARHASGTIVISNRAGGGGLVAVREAAGAPADGSVLLLGNVGTHVVLPRVSPAAPHAALAPLAKIASIEAILVATPSLPAGSLAEMLAAGRARAGALSYASSGIGSIGHLTMEALCAHAGVTMIHVPYKSGPASIPDLLGGRVQLALLNLGAGIPLIRQRRLRAFAVTGHARHRELPELPTLLESGYGDTAIENWHGLFVSAATTASRRLALSAVVDQVMRDGMFRRAAESQRLEVAAPGSAQAFEQLIKMQARQVDQLLARGLVHLR